MIQYKSSCTARHHGAKHLDIFAYVVRSLRFKITQINAIIISLRLCTLYGIFLSNFLLLDLTNHFHKKSRFIHFIWCKSLCISGKKRQNKYPQQFRHPANLQSDLSAYCS